MGLYAEGTSTSESKSKVEIVDEGRRPAVLSGRDLRQCGPDGLLVPFDPESPNGLMIAAAPDLLEAIEFAIAAIDSWRDPLTNPLQRAVDQKRAESMVRAAVAKARGGA